MSDFKENADKKKVDVDPAVIVQATKVMGEAKARILFTQPFYGTLLSMTDFIPEPAIKTMATDGINIYYSPEYTIALSKEERQGVLLHEISHCVYLHCSPKRRMNREHKRWNVASDYAINLEIRDMGYTLPPNVLLDDKYRDMNAEMIYDALPNNIDDLETLDVHIEPSDGTAEWDDMEDRIVAAYEMTKNADGAGRLPNGISRWLDKMKKSRVKWERIFHRFVGQALARDDFSYSRCNRRMMPQDVYLPALRNQIIGNVVIGVDTSGSITQGILEQFASELKKISHLVDEITVMTCDADVHEVVKIRKMDDFLKKIKFLGGGGTDFRPVFQEVEKRKEMPELLIYLTDAFGNFPERKPPYPVMWCLTDDSGEKCIPWGESVVIPEKHKI